MSRQWCLSSVTLVHPTQTVKLFGNIVTRFCTSECEVSTFCTSWEDHANFHDDRPKGTPPPGGVKYKRGRRNRPGRFVANLVNGASL